MNNTTWTAEQVWAAAALASRTNNDEYLRNDEWIPDPTNPNSAVPGRKSSRSLMLDGLNNLDSLTEQDYQDGRDARRFLHRRYTFQALKSELNGFEGKLVEAITKEEFNRQHSTEFSVIASQVPRWKSHVSEEVMLRGTITAPMATVGERVTKDITVIRTVWSEKYQLHFITAKTNCNHVVFFAYKQRMPAGQICKINGTVKAHRTDSTQLNRVKVIDQ